MNELIAFLVSKLNFRLDWIGLDLGACFSGKFHPYPFPLRKET